MRANHAADHAAMLKCAKKSSCPRVPQLHRSIRTSGKDLLPVRREDHLVYPVFSMQAHLSRRCDHLFCKRWACHTADNNKKKKPFHFFPLQKPFARIYGLAVYVVTQLVYLVFCKRISLTYSQTRMESGKVLPATKNALTPALSRAKRPD